MTKTLWMPVLRSDQYVLLTHSRDISLSDEWGLVPDNKIKYEGLEDQRVTSGYLRRDIIEFLNETDDNWRLSVYTYVSEFTGSTRGLFLYTEVKIIYRSLDSNILMLKLIL